MPDTIDTDVLVIGEGCAGQAAALAARERGARVTLLYSGQASSTAISTGFVTYAAHEGFTREEVLDAMANTTGKGLCDMALLERLVREAPVEMAATIEQYRIPVERAPRGYRVRRAGDKRGRDLLDERYGLDGARDMTGLMMEFSSTHGTALFAQLRKAVAAADIQRLKGSALSLTGDGPGAWVLVEGEAVKIEAGAVILATGGLQGVYDFTDTPRNLLGDGQSMALEIGAELVDMEFIQFYPLAVCEQGVPAIFLYPDYPEQAKLVNSTGEDLIAKHLSGGTTLGALHNWDQLSVVIQAEIVAGQEVYIDFRDTRAEDWAPDSLTATFLSKYIPDFRERLIRIAPSSHYTMGGVRTDPNGQTSVPGVYACGEVAGGVHGANRHGGTALVEAITFGRISGRHAADNLRAGERNPAGEAAPASSREGEYPAVEETLQAVRQINQRALGAYRNAELLKEAGDKLARLAADAAAFGWDGLAQFEAVQRLQRVIRLSELMRRAMLRRTESRGTHSRADFPETDPDWRRKQAVKLSADGEALFDDVPL